MNQWRSLRSLIELPSPREKKLSLEVTIKPTIQAHPLLTSPLLSTVPKRPEISSFPPAPVMLLTVNFRRIAGRDD